LWRVSHCARVVLSAAHCQKPGRAIYVVIGRHDLRNTKDGDVVLVKRKVIHPEYNAASSSFDNDYMILILERDTTEKVDYLKVNPNWMFIGGNVAVTTMGYGHSYPGHLIRITYQEPILNHAEVFTLTNEECNAAKGTSWGVESFGWFVGGIDDATYAGRITENMICAGDEGKLEWSTVDAYDTWCLLNILLKTKR